MLLGSSTLCDSFSFSLVVYIFIYMVGCLCWNSFRIGNGVQNVVVVLGGGRVPGRIRSGCC